jgi:hypothetical protein
MRVSSEVALERDVLRALVTGGPCSTRRLKAHISFVLSEDQVQEVLNRLVESELVTKMEGARDDRRYVEGPLPGFHATSPSSTGSRPLSQTPDGTGWFGFLLLTNTKNAVTILCLGPLVGIHHQRVAKTLDKEKLL